MGLLALFRKTTSSANVAKERLRIIVAQERNARGNPDYLPLLRRELLEVIHRYVNVDPSAVQVNLEFEDGHEVLELSVALPDRSAPLHEARPYDARGPSAILCRPLVDSAATLRGWPCRSSPPSTQVQHSLCFWTKLTKS